VAALVRHYVFQQDLPEVNDEAAEFSQVSTK
jgi:hypothetical protein